MFTASLDEHDQNIFRLFRRLSDASLRLQPEKCTFLATEVGHLGHVISAEGVRPYPKKIEAVKNFPIPKSAKNIKEFLGLVRYYRRFILNIASRSKPLTNLLKKGRAFDWGEAQQAAFEDLRDLLCHELILQCPNFNLPFILTTDASATAIGTVLSQDKIGEDLPIVLALRTWNRAESNYSASERECLAVVFFTKHFRHYLYGRKFTIVTEHQALAWLHNTSVLLTHIHQMMRRIFVAFRLEGRCVRESQGDEWFDFLTTVNTFHRRTMSDTRERTIPLPPISSVPPRYKRHVYYS